MSLGILADVGGAAINRSTRARRAWHRGKTPNIFSWKLDVGCWSSGKSQDRYGVFAEGLLSKPLDLGWPPRGQCGQEENQDQVFGKREYRPVVLKPGGDPGIWKQGPSMPKGGG